MKMEHLHNKRNSTDTMVTIAYAPLGIVSARMIRLCHEGIYIDTGPIYLQAGQPVEVFFRQANGQLLGLKAMTSHSSRHGTELQLVDKDAPRLVADIQHPLYRTA